MKKKDVINLIERIIREQLAESTALSDKEFRKHYPKAEINGNFATTFPYQSTMYGLWKKFPDGWYVIKGTTELSYAQNWLKSGKIK